VIQGNGVREMVLEGTFAALSNADRIGEIALARPKHIKPRLTSLADRRRS